MLRDDGIVDVVDEEAIVIGADCVISLDRDNVAVAFVIADVAAADTFLLPNRSLGSFFTDCTVSAPFVIPLHILDATPLLVVVVVKENGSFG
jgi:predicted thioredoxin/glutaredoxin